MHKNSSTYLISVVIIIASTLLAEAQTKQNAKNKHESISAISSEEAAESDRDRWEAEKAEILGRNRVWGRRTRYRAYR